MTRDAELAARRYVRLGADQAHGESDIGVLSILLARMQAAIERFGAPDNRAAMRTYLAEQAEESMRAAEPGSDPQLVWAQTFAANAHSDDQLRLVRELLDGDADVKGLAVDTDLRWHLLFCLASAGRADDAMIDAEISRDPTDQGRRRGAGARAARPTEAAKAAAWDSLLTDAAMPLAMKRALLNGFNRYGQDALLRPYAQRYPEALPTIWDGRNAEESLLLTEGLFPSAVIEDGTLQIAAAALALDSVPEPGKRLIVEAEDAAQRALRARTADTP
jgi:aminopeptidase N